MSGGWSTTQARAGGDNKSKLDDMMQIYEFDDGGDFDTVRPIGRIWSYYQFWITIDVKKEGEKKAKRVTIPKLCLDYDPKTETMKTDICPYRRAYESGKYNYKIKVGQREQPAIRFEKKYLGNFIIRSLQESQPRKLPKHTKSELKKQTILGYAAFYKQFKPELSKSWTPVRVIKVPPSLAVQFKSIHEVVNKKRIKKGKPTYELSDPKFGIDIEIKYNSKLSGTAMYSAQSGGASKLTEEELDYLMFNLDVLKPEDLKTAKDEWNKIKSKIPKNPDGDDDEDDDEDLEDSKSKKKKKSSKQDDDDDDDDDIDSDLEDDDEDEDEKPSKKKSSKSSKASKSSKKKPKDDDDDDDDGLDSLDDDDEDEKPSKKKSNKASNVKKTSKTSKAGKASKTSSKASKASKTSKKKKK